MMRDDVSFIGKTIAVVGMARTGMAAAQVLTELGAKVVLYDRKPAAALSMEIARAEELGAKVYAESDMVDFSGVDMLIASPAVPAASPIFAEAASKKVEIASEIEVAYRISKAPIVAITGTNGKTTTTILTGRIFERDGRKTYVAGNVLAGDIKLPLIEAAQRADSESIIVAEISTFQLEWITSFRPKVAMLLNIGADHLDRHTPDEYAALKASVFRYQRADDFSAFNMDNPAALSMSDKSCGKKLYFTRHKRVDEGAWIDGDAVKVRIGSYECEVCSIEDISASGNLPGAHSQENVMAAACAAIALGARPESVASAVRDFPGVVHRMERVAVIDGVDYINNSMCTNEDAFVRSIESVSRTQVIIAGGIHKGGRLSKMAAAVKAHARHLVLIGASSQQIEAEVRKIGFQDITLAETLEEAVKTAASVARPGDVVILAPEGSSFDMFSGFEERGDTFKEAVRRLSSEGWRG